MARQAKWTSRQNEKLVSFIRDRGEIVSLDVDSEWRLVGRYGGADITIIQSSPGRRFLVNGEPAATQAEAICEVIEASARKQVVARPKMAAEPRGSDLAMRGALAVEKHLKRQGYDIIARDYECDYGIADFIAWHADMLVFIEAITRPMDSGMPMEDDGEVERDRWERIAMSYLATAGIEGWQYRFDAITVCYYGNGLASMRHNLFRFGQHVADAGQRETTACAG